MRPQFGRTFNDDKAEANERGHNAKGFAMWMAGGSVKGGHVYGSTDETGR